MFTITYDFTHVFIPQRGSAKCYTPSTGNQVGRFEGQPIGYGYNGPAAIFRLEEIPHILEVLKVQLRTTPTLHIHPCPCSCQE